MVLCEALASGRTQVKIPGDSSSGLEAGFHSTRCCTRFLHSARPSNGSLACHKSLPSDDLQPGSTLLRYSGSWHVILPTFQLFFLYTVIPAETQSEYLLLTVNSTQPEPRSLESATCSGIPAGSTEITVILAPRVLHFRRTCELTVA